MSEKKPSNRSDWGGRMVGQSGSHNVSHHTLTTAAFSLSLAYGTIFTAQRNVSVMCQIMNTAQNGTGGGTQDIFETESIA